MTLTYLCEGKEIFGNLWVQYSDFVGDNDDMKSTMGQAFFLGGRPITWITM